MRLPGNGRLWAAGPARRPAFGWGPGGIRDRVRVVLILTLLSLLITDGSHGWPVMGAIWRAVRRFFGRAAQDPFMDN